MADKNKIIEAIKQGKIVDEKSMQFFFMTELFDEIKSLKLTKSVEDKMDAFIERVRVINGKNGDNGHTPDDKELLDLIKPLMTDVYNILNKKIPTKDEIFKTIEAMIPDVKNGATPSKAELLSIINPLIPKIDYEYILNETIKHFPNIEDIEKDLPKLGTAIRDALELLEGEDRLDASAIKGLPQFIENTKKVVLGGYGGLNLFVNGIKKGATKTLDFVGSGVSFSKINGRETITFPGAMTYKGVLDASGGVYPSNPAKGDYYIISVAGTISGTVYAVGDWAVYDGSAWDRVENQQYIKRVGTTISPVSDGDDFDILTGAIKKGNYHVEPKEENDGNADTTLEIDLSDASSHLITLIAGCALTFINPQVGGAYVLRIVQGGAGSFTPTFPAEVDWGARGVPTWSTTAGLEDLINLYWTGAKYLASYSLGYTA